METKRKDIKYQIQQGYKLQTIMHYVNRETLIKQHNKQQMGKANGIDGITKEEYDKNLEVNIENLLTRMKRLSYRPRPVRKTYIPKSNGKLRGLGIPCYEDKLVQGAMADVLNEIYENFFILSSKLSILLDRFLSYSSVVIPSMPLALFACCLSCCFISVSLLT